MNFYQEGLPAIGAVVTGRTEVSSLAYHEEGRRLYAASEVDSKLQIIDCLNGKAEQPALRCEREHIRLVEATHHEDAILIAGTGSSSVPIGQRHAVSYWSLHDNKIVRKFRGHSDQITTVSMSPADDSFLSSSRDRTVRLWNLQSAGCVGELKLPDAATSPSSFPLATYDSTGLVFCITAAMSEQKGYYVHLYDARNYGSGAFAELKVSRLDLENAIVSYLHVPQDRAAYWSRADWTSIQFNVSGNQIVVGTDLGLVILLDGFEGTIQRVLSGNTSNAERPAACCVTPDDKTILVGNDDGSMTCWDVGTGTVAKRLEGHAGPIRCIAANPKYAQLASSCTQTALWVW